MATKKALVKPRGKKVHRPTKVHLREMTGLTYILIPDKKELEVPKNINEISMYGFSCREELTREIMDNMSNEFVNNSVMAFAATYEKWENNKAISKPVMSEKELRDFTGLMDIFVGGIGSGIAPLEFLEACGPRQIEDCKVYGDKIIVYRGLPQPIYLHNPTFVSYFAGAARLCLAVAKADKAGRFLTMCNVALAKAAISRASAASRKKLGIELIEAVRPTVTRNFFATEAFVPSGSYHFEALQSVAKDFPSTWGSKFSISANWDYDRVDILDCGFDESSGRLTRALSKPAPKKKANQFLYY